MDVCERGLRLYTPTSFDATCVVAYKRQKNQISMTNEVNCGGGVNEVFVCFCSFALCVLRARSSLSVCIYLGHMQIGSGHLLEYFATCSVIVLCEQLARRER